MDSLGEVLGHVFARLVPVNSTAKAIFSNIIETVVENSTDAEKSTPYLHASQFMRANKPSSNRGRENVKIHWLVHFEPPNRSRKGPHWILGSARGEGWKDEVDLVLDMGDHHEVCERHASIFFHPESHQLTLHAIHVTYLGGRGGGEEFENKTRVLEHGDTIVIGPLVYKIEFEQRCSLPEFATELWQFLKAECPSSTPLHRSLRAPSAARTAVIGNYSCPIGGFAQGASGVILGGIDIAGNAVAIKRFLRLDRKKLEEHKRIMEKIDNHILESHKINFEAQVILFWDWANGINHLHSRGIMHRDVSWNNLGIMLGNPPKGVLLDLDGATDHKRSRGWTQGTLCFNAPAMIDMMQRHRNGTSTSLIGYDKAIDIWALAICGTVMITEKAPMWWAYGKTDDKPDPADLESKQKRNYVKNTSIISL
ncbi:MAG: hypothetical protein LQ350_002696 [Teloschistes chrysophthalmus]|nr:MAG: hypothetical protein LQ350_002696 [Niorma chrysophthalma]